MSNMQVGSKMKNDIQTEQDIDFFVNKFYNKLIKDSEIKHFFDGIDLDEHLPKIAHFWKFVLLNVKGYKTNVVEKHMYMPLEQKHFDVWLNHFNNTLDEHFEGENVEEAKRRAAVIGWTLNSKINNKK